MISSMILDFCKQKLARILYDCVECSCSNRGMLDWLTAERFTLDNIALVDEVISVFLAQPVAVGLSGNSLVPPNIDTSFEGLERVCGRAVWDNLYQPLRKVLKMRLQMPRYTGIRFM